MSALIYAYIVCYLKQGHYVDLKWYSFVCDESPLHHSFRDEKSRGGNEALDKDDQWVSGYSSMGEINSGVLFRSRETVDNNAVCLIYEVLVALNCILSFPEIFSEVTCLCELVCFFFLSGLHASICSESIEEQVSYKICVHGVLCCRPRWGSKISISVKFLDNIDDDAKMVIS